MKWVIGVVVILAVVVGGVGYWVMQSRKAEVGIPEKDWNQQQAAPTDVVTEATTAPSGQVKEVVVEGSDFKFAPNTIKVKKGDTVRLTFKNSGPGTHALVIGELGVETNQIGEGEEEEVEFTADKAGTFEYYCPVGNHRAMGMIGKLIVE